MTMEIQTYLAPEGLFETPDHFLLENESVHDNWMDVELDLNSSSLSLFHDVVDVQEVKDSQEADVTNTALLSELISQCGIPVEEDTTTIFPCSPASSMDSDMEAHQSLIDELEEYFGSPTKIDEVEDSRGLDLVTKTTIASRSSPNSILEALTAGQVFNDVQEDNILTEQDLKGAVTTSCVTEDGQNVIIIIAPPSPASSTTANYDTDPDWSPSPASPSSLRTLSPTSTTIKKKYQRSKPPTPPTGPYPVEKKERKKAQNRTAAFRYREKRKSEQDEVESELELLHAKNIGLRDRLTEMETEAKLLKKLMIEAGLGRYANTIRL